MFGYFGGVMNVSLQQSVAVEAVVEQTWEQLDTY